MNDGSSGHALRSGQLDRVCPLCGHDGARPIAPIKGWRRSVCDRCGFLYAPQIRTASGASVIDGVPPLRPTGRHRQIRRLVTRLVGSAALTLGLQGPLPEPLEVETPVDAVVLDHVLDRVADPRIVVREAVAALAPGGVLVVVVANRVDIRRFSSGWRRVSRWNPPHQVNFFTAKALRSMLTDAGLDVVPFGARAMDRRDLRDLPRSALEALGVHPFGLRMYGRRPTPT